MSEERAEYHTSQDAMDYVGNPPFVHEPQPIDSEYLYPPEGWEQTIGLAATPPRYVPTSVHTLIGKTCTVTIDGEYIHIQRHATQETLYLDDLRLCRPVR